MQSMLYQIRKGVQMKIYFDEQEIILSDRAKRSLRIYMQSLCQCFAEQYPKDAGVWTWGRATIGNLADAKSISFSFGGQEDRPKDQNQQFVVSAQGGQ